MLNLFQQQRRQISQCVKAAVQERLLKYCEVVGLCKSRRNDFIWGKKCFEITQTSPHSHIPAEQGDERLAGNLNTCRLQGSSSAIKERPQQQEKKKRKKN